MSIEDIKLNEMHQAPERRVTSVCRSRRRKMKANESILRKVNLD